MNAAFSQGTQPDQRAVTVTRVVDGDTVEISPAIGGKEDVRLIGVDTPETVDRSTDVQPYGPQASRFTTQQLEEQRVTLQFDEEREDQFGRLLAYVRLDGALFNETLLRQGYAQLYTVSPNDRYESRFRQAQQQARQAKRGIWGLSRAQQCRLADRGNGIGEGSPGCEGAPNPNPPPNPGGDRDCADFPSQAAAQRELRRDPSDPFGLDGPEGRGSTGIPGVACEGNPPPEDLIPAPGYGGRLPETGGPPPIGAPDPPGASWSACGALRSSYTC